jgi:hypothetical protein
VPELGATVVEAVVDLSSNAPAILNWHQVTPAGSAAATDGLTWLRRPPAHLGMLLA